MKTTRSLLACAALAGAQAAFAAFPEKTVTLVVPYPPGGATDTLARIMAKGMGERLGQTMVVDNRSRRRNGDRGRPRRQGRARRLHAADQLEHHVHRQPRPQGQSCPTTR